MHCGGSSWGICCLQGLETPQVSPQSSANLPRPTSPRLPRLSCCWQVLAAKNSSGGDSSLGLKEGDESGEGRQLHSQTRWGWGVVGGEYPPPPRHSPQQLTVCRAAWEEGTGLISGGRAKPGAVQRSASPHTPGLGCSAASRVISACRSTGHGRAGPAVSAMGPAAGPGCRVLGAPSPRARPAAPRDVWGGPESTLFQTSPLTREQKAFLSQSA